MKQRKTPVLASLIYCVSDDNVLLLNRFKKPYKGYWVAPGGKIEERESPFNCAKRELEEETGLTADEISLRGIITEISPRDDWQWMIFIYISFRFSGTVLSESLEGILKWWSLSELTKLKLPEADRIFIDKIFRQGSSIYEATFSYDKNLLLTDVKEHSQ